MFVIDHKENVTLINHKIVCDLTRTFFFVIYHKRFCYYSDVCQTRSVINCGIGRLLGNTVIEQLC